MYFNKNTMEIYLNQNSFIFNKKDEFMNNYNDDRN